MDDYIIAIPTDKVNGLLKAISNCDPKLQFTQQIEEIQCLIFLDFILIRNTTQKNRYTKFTS